MSKQLDPIQSSARVAAALALGLWATGWAVAASAPAPAAGAAPAPVAGSSPAAAPSPAPAPAAAAGGTAAPAGRGPAFMNLPAVPLFISESWQRKSGETGEMPVTQENLSVPNTEIKVYGLDAKNLVIAGTRGNPNYLVNLWSGLSREPIAVTLRDPSSYVDLSGRARIRWVIRTAGFHQVRPVIRLADGTLLVGDHADSSTTLFDSIEFAVADIRWLKLDAERVVTLGSYGPAGQAATFVENPDLSRVDEVGYADLMPGSGHGAGGWANVATIEIYGKPVRR
jgi:hypothetical protein